MFLENSTRLPSSHVESLKQIESGYWWFVGRTNWVLTYANEWLSASKKSANQLEYLDIGCGTGGLAYTLTQELGFRRVTLSDPHPHVSSEISADPKVRVLAKTIEELNPETDQADLITACDVLEHVKEPIQFLHQVERLLKPGGTCILTVPAFQSLYSDWDRHLGHYRRYHKYLLSNQIKHAGLKLESSHYFWGPLFPVGFLRKQKKILPGEMEFPPTPKILNELLIRWAFFEAEIRNTFPMPFGTSLIARMTKA